MPLFVGSSMALDPAAFDDAIRRGTRDLAEVLAAVARTRSAAVEPTHFLMALGRVPGGETQRGLARRDLTPDQWQSGLASCARADDPPTPVRHLTSGTLHMAAQRMLREAQVRSGLDGTAISEAALLAAGLATVLTPPDGG